MALQRVRSNMLANNFVLDDDQGLTVGSGNNIYIDTASNQVGINTNTTTHALTVNGDISATNFYGDGSQLTGLSSTLDEVTTNGATTTNSITVGGLIVNSTGAIGLPVGTTGERPTAADGLIRFNSDLVAFEGYDGNEWGALGGGGATYSTTAPTTNLKEGDLWFDTGTTGELYVYSGSEWLSVTGSGDAAGFYQRDFTGDASTTAFNVYGPANSDVFVYMNGVLVTKPADYSYANGIVTFVTPPSLNDEISVYVFGGASSVSLTSLGLNSTDDISEGSTNLYYTDTRVQNYLDTAGTLTETDTLATVTGRGASTTTNVEFNGTGNSVLVSDTLRIAQTGSGLRMTNVGAFDNDGSDNFRLFATNTLYLRANGETGGGIVIDDVNQNVTIDNDLIVSGNLTVNGTTTTINSTTLTVDDLNITLASGAADAAAANGSGITVDGANAQITYDGTNDEWDFNKNLNVSGSFPKITLTETDNSNTYTIINQNFGYLTIDNDAGGTDAGHGIIFKMDQVEATRITQDKDITWNESNGGTPQVGMHWDYADGRLGIGDTTPDYLLDLYGNPGTDAGSLLRLNSSQTDDNGIIHEQADGTKWFTGQESSNANDYEFWNYDGAVWSNILHVGSDGRIGVGTSSPATMMHIHDATNPGVRLTTSDGSNTPMAQLEYATGSGYFLRLGDAANNEDIMLRTYGDSYFGGGAVGIGTNSVSAGTKLEVQGEASGNWISIIKNTHNSNGGGLKVLAGDDADTTSFRVSTYNNDTLFDVRGDGEVTATRAYNTELVRHSIRPALSLEFATTKELDPSITFYRDSIATYYDSKGILQYASENEPRFDHDPLTGKSKGLLIEESRQNEFTDTTFLSAHWNLDQNVGKQFNAGVAPDGTYSAVKVVPNDVSASKYVSDQITVGNSESITISVYMKSAGATYGYISHANTGFNARATMIVNLTNGNIEYQSGSTDDPTIETFVQELPNGWYRFGLTATSDSTGGGGQVVIGPSAVAAPVNDSSDPTGPTDQNEAILIWGPQREVNPYPYPVATSYIPADTVFASRASEATYYDENGIIRTVPINSPRRGYGYDGRNWVETGLIVEDAATNYMTRTMKDFDHNMASAPTYNQAAPDGSNTAVDVNVASSNWSTDYFYTGYSSHQASTVAGTYTFSFFVKPDTSGEWPFNLYFDNSHHRVTATVEAGRWQRVSTTFTTQALNSTFNAYAYDNRDSLGDISSGVVWGPQVEDGIVATSYIYTPTSTATRSADVINTSEYTRGLDVAQIDNIQNSDWNNEDAGTFYTEHQVPYDIEEINNNFRILERHNGVGTNGTSIIHNGGTDQLNAGMYNNNGWQALMGVTGGLGVVDKNTIYKTAFAYAPNDFALSVQGSDVATDTSGTLTYGNTTLQLGGNYALNAVLNGHLKAVRFYSERLSNNELKALTEND